MVSLLDTTEQLWFNNSLHTVIKFRRPSIKPSDGISGVKNDRLKAQVNEFKATEANPGRERRSKLGWVRWILLRVLCALAILYVCFVTFIWWAMHQPPEFFGSVMAKMPGPVVFLLVPFETLWSHARGGVLNPGDLAPDFELQKVDRSESVRLSELNQQRPVVLVFGSYT